MKRCGGSHRIALILSYRLCTGRFYVYNTQRDQQINQFSNKVECAVPRHLSILQTQFSMSRLPLYTYTLR